MRSPLGALRIGAPGRGNVIGWNASHGVVILEKDGLVVKAFDVDHAPIHPAVGYRFEYKGRSVVVSGDTVKSKSLVAASKGVDALFHEAQARSPETAAAYLGHWESRYAKGSAFRE